MNIDTKLCDVCGACVSVCPVDAIIVSEFSVSLNSAVCIDCGNCLVICPARAISRKEGV